ncbi:MAG: heme-binding protein [Candidatus Methylarchaceae archaeon HK01B]|nr:heme-binding protein [Candidatus Methylarchaceae archaeon HK01M]MCP8312152.1 heme-binding protein [Candidatus Methylarchaceae archaeon HK02M1]MCP8318408.1 heme-binding protein [Candidatus Methylarchaceae archaeon HK01B]
MVKKVKYEVIRKLEKVEIRRYKSLVIARVDGFGDRGFSILFQFITGNNRQKTRVDMTAPVLSERIEMTAPVLSDTGSIAFVMPEAFTLETTPDPIDERVKILEVPGRFVAALQFSGRWSESIFNSRSKELLDELAKAEVKTKGSVFAMRYSGPYTPWFMRRNEVAIEVELDQLS